MPAPAAAMRAAAGYLARAYRGCVLFSRAKSQLPTPEQALPGRPDYPFEVPTTHVVTGNRIVPPFPEGLQTGRIWGVWNEGLLPIRWETVQVSLRDAFRIRRIYRKLARRKGSGFPRRITVFVRHENVVKFLVFLGYCLE